MLDYTKNWNIVKIFEMILVIFGLFILYQIIKKIFGGSLTVEDMIISLLVFNIGATFTIGIMFAQLKSDLNYLRDQFKSYTIYSSNRFSKIDDRLEKIEDKLIR